MKLVDLSIITVNWKVAELVGQLLDSIAEHTQSISYEIFVVDNDSGDGIGETISRFRKKYPQISIQFIENKQNLGFAAANNIAIASASGRYTVLLNPDTALKDDALSSMVHWLDAHEDVGIAGPKLLNSDGTIQPSVRAFPQVMDQALILLKMHHFVKNAPALQRYFAADFNYKKTQDVDQVMGAAFFIRKEVFSTIGVLDDAFFIWFEEVDFCRRAKSAGYRIAYVATSEIVHHGGESFAKTFTVLKQKYFNASMKTYFKKHHPQRAWVLVLPLVIGLFLAKVISLARKK